MTEKDTSAETERCEDLPLCMHRRDVLAAGAVGTAAAVLYPHLAEAGPHTGEKLGAYPRLRVAKVGDLKEGEPVAFSYPLEQQPNMIVKLGAPAQGGVGPDGDIVAFSVLCTHMGGSLRGRYRHDFKSMGPCPFHFSTFDLTRGGAPVHASATQNLPQVLLETDGTDIYAVGMNGLVYGYRDNLADGAMAANATAPGSTRRG
ncbi:MAG: arsenate reductase (azurin) small subunit [Methyloligellaceae bacterium]